jgi:hypothetical protein
MENARYSENWIRPAILNKFANPLKMIFCVYFLFKVKYKTKPYIKPNQLGGAVLDIFGNHILDLLPI